MKKALFKRNDFGPSNGILKNKSAKVLISNVCYENGQICIDAFFNNYGNDDIDLLIYHHNGSFYEADERNDYDGPYNIVFCGKNIDITHFRRFYLPLDKVSSYSLAYYDKKEDELFNPKKVSVMGNSKIGGMLGRRIGDFYVTFSGNLLNITSFDPKFTSFFNIFKQVYYKKLKKIYHTMHGILFFRLFNKEEKKYILINDREDVAGDNGEALFKHIMMNRPDLKENTYFVIKWGCKDYRRLKKDFGHVISRKSLRHRIMFLNSKVIYSSHAVEERYRPIDFGFYKDMLRYKLVWIRHGITSTKAADDYCFRKPDYIINSANYEYEFFTTPYYGYRKDQVLLTGLARFDFLKSEPKNIISIAPTWRRYVKNDDFSKSDYYKAFEAILGNEELLEVLRKRNYKINFFLHPQLREYTKYFEKFGNDVITVIGYGDVNYNQIFSESKLFITDYSSTAFDFAYLKKPLIYYQFDRDAFYGQHYEEGLFSFKDQGFGEVIEDPENMLKKIRFYLDNDFQMEEKYLKRIEETFPYTDKGNCERILSMTSHIL